MPIALAVFFVVLAVWGVILRNQMREPEKNGKLTVIATLFPTYDFAKAIGGDKVEVSLLLPPGVEPHSFEPKPSDVARIDSADVFVYTGKFMEPWAEDIIGGSDMKGRTVDASAGIDPVKDDDAEASEHGGVDPHIWLDFGNAKIMAADIAQAFESADPGNADYYQANLENYQRQLDQLDAEYSGILATCQSRTIVYGGHYAFGYLAKRYGLDYEAAEGLAPDAEPSASDLAALVDQIRKEKIGYVFYEELASPKIAETLAQETGAKLLLLNGAHNVSKDDLESGVSYLSIMEDNLKNLMIGLDCQR